MFWIWADIVPTIGAVNICSNSSKFSDLDVQPCCVMSTKNLRMWLILTLNYSAGATGLKAPPSFSVQNVSIRKKSSGNLSTGKLSGWQFFSYKVSANQTKGLPWQIWPSWTKTTSLSLRRLPYLYYHTPIKILLVEQ